MSEEGWIYKCGMCGQEVRGDQHHDIHNCIAYLEKQLEKAKSMVHHEAPVREEKGGIIEQH